LLFSTRLDHIGRRLEKAQCCCCLGDAPIEAADLAEQFHGDLAQGAGQYSPGADAV
jgi:hypothetical protein